MTLLRDGTPKDKREMRRDGVSRTRGLWEEVGVDEDGEDEDEPHESCVMRGVRVKK
jgi:hypothetical protein